MYREDIAGSIAHATMLAKCGIISGADKDAIIGGLKDILAKIESGDPTCASAETVYRLATRGGAEAFGLDAGEVRVGAAADFVILDPNRLPLVPGFNRTSDLVYAADPSCVDTVVCAGRVLMEGGVIPGEAEIVAAARAAAASLTAAT